MWTAPRTQHPCAIRPECCLTTQRLLEGGGNPPPSDPDFIVGKTEILQKEMLIGAASGTPTFGLLGSRLPPLTPPLRRTREGGGGGAGLGKDKAGPGQGPGRQRTRGWGIGGAPGWPPHNQALGGAGGGGGKTASGREGGAGVVRICWWGIPKCPSWRGGGGAVKALSWHNAWDTGVPHGRGPRSGIPRAFLRRGTGHTAGVPRGRGLGLGGRVRTPRTSGVTGTPPPLHRRGRPIGSLRPHMASMGGGGLRLSPTAWHRGGGG